MIMVNSYDEWQKIISNITDWKYFKQKFPIYRGHKRDTYFLEPSIVRYIKNPEQLRLKEKEILDLFYKLLGDKNKTCILSSPFLNAEFHNVWLKLFQAQHLGLPTRLMDWTPGPDIALYFATERDERESEDDDSFHGIVWMLPCNQGEMIEYDNEFKLQTESPFEFKQTKIINPSFLYSDDFREKLPEQRRFYQGGRFTIQSYDLCIKPLEFQKDFLNRFQRIVINKDAKKGIRDKLNEMNVNWDSLYRKTDSEIKDIVDEIKRILKSIKLTEY